MSAERDRTLAGVVTLLLLVGGWLLLTYGIAAAVSPKAWPISIGLLLLLFAGIKPFLQLVTLGFAALLVEDEPKRGGRR